MKNFIRIPPRDTGFDNASINAGQTRDGIIIPWRVRSNFQTVWILMRTMTSPSYELQATWVSWDGATVQDLRRPLQSITNASGVWACWINDNTTRSTSGTPQNTVIPVLLGAPYIRFSMTNNGGATLTGVFLDVTLMDGVVQA